MLVNKNVLRLSMWKEVFYAKQTFFTTVCN